MPVVDDFAVTTDARLPFTAVNELPTGPFNEYDIIIHLHE